MKKYIKNKSIYSVFFLVFLFTGCEDFEEMNRNPTTSTQMDPNIMLPAIQMQLTGGRYEQWRNGLIYSSIWMQHWAGEYASIEYGGKGKKNNVYMGALWETQYPREVKNVVDMVDRTADDPGMSNINAVARIMKVYIFSRLTDLYGDIPYFQAGGGYTSGVLTPEYDRQEDIYYDFFEELELAVEALDIEGDPITHDLYYNGDISKWKKFGNSLRLRLAMRLVKVDPDKARMEAEEAIASGTMQDISDIAVMQHIDVPFGGSVFGGNGLSYAFMNVSPEESPFRITTTFAGYMQETKDPRITMYARSYLKDEERTDITKEVHQALGSYVEMGLMPSKFLYEAVGGPIIIPVNGEPEQVARAYQLMQPSIYITRPAAPYVIMGYAEVELWKAEAAVRGWTTGASAQEHFETALVAGVVQMVEIFGAPEATETEIDDFSIAAFVAANPLLPGEELEQINLQLWVNFALNGQEAFANWRRSGYPDIEFPNPYPGENQTGGEIPRRLEYPVNEYLLNTENVEEAVSRLPGGVDDWMARVWWDAPAN